MGRDEDWHEHVPLRPVTLDDGSRAGPGPMMRRREGGRWAYRRMTPDEIADYLSREGW